MDLRAEIAAIVHRHKLKGADDVAKRILALPEIRDALSLYRSQNPKDGEEK